ncbi:MAG TPA: hypothetical protein DDX33_04185 [Rikenellaceae bacterium]|nr:hypothetical protein [Rikenellaceae bacterium]
MMAASCGKENVPDEPVVPMKAVVYAVGQEIVPGAGFYYASIWKDGVRTRLSDGTYDAFCNGVYADGDNVYIVGCEATGDLVDDGYYDPYQQNVGVMWNFKVGDEANAIKTTLSDGKYSTSPLAATVCGGKVYVAGFDSPSYDRRAIMWEDGQIKYLTDGTTDALAYCIYSDGKDVYVGGYVQSADDSSYGVATIWKNGVAQNLTDGKSLAKVNAIYVDGGKVYAAGAEREKSENWRGVLWIDGVAQYFTEVCGTEVTGLYVKDGKWIVEGNMTDDNSDIHPYIWTAEGAELVSDVQMCQGLGLAVDEDDVYVAGTALTGYDEDYNTLFKGYLWKNGEVQALETDSEDFSLWDVTCAYVPEQ